MSQRHPERRAANVRSEESEGRRHLVKEGCRAPALRLAGDTDDGLEPHICRSID